MTAETRRLADESLVASLVRTLVSRIRVWIADSWLVSEGATLTNTLETAASTSAIATAAKTLARYVRHSYLYRWLTAEPDPDVVVIDLRETYAVGPLIAILDRVRPPLGRARRTSRLGALLHETATAVREAPIRAISVVAVAAVLANALSVALDGPLATETVLARVAVLGLALAGTRVGTPWDELARARIVRLLVAALEPPEPPAEDRRE